MIVDKSKVPEKLTVSTVPFFLWATRYINEGKFHTHSLAPIGKCANNRKHHIICDIWFFSMK